jgi:urate oxidase
MGITLGANQYGKAENRVVRIYRDTPRHTIVDLNVSTSLRGEFADAHTDGDQSDILPTDTQKNTSFAFAKEHGVTSPEDYALALGRHFLETAPKAHSAQIKVEQYGWDRIPVGPDGHDHSFVRRGDLVRTAVVTVNGRGADQQAWVVSGVKDLVVLKSTGSEFKGYLKDRYTTLVETDDRIMATSLVSRWRYAGTNVDWNAAHEQILQTLLAGFANTYSRALQETLYVMGKDVLESQPDVVEVKFSAPNKHHFLYDLDRFGIANNNEVFIADDRPYGLIEATVARDDAPAAGDAWLAVPGFL